jgi:hypothetical protein
MRGRKQARNTKFNTHAAFLLFFALFFALFFSNSSNFPCLIIATICGQLLCELEKQSFLHKRAVATAFPPFSLARAKERKNECDTLLR